MWPQQIFAKLSASAIITICATILTTSWIHVTDAKAAAVKSSGANHKQIQRSGSAKALLPVGGTSSNPPTGEKPIELPRFFDADGAEVKRKCYNATFKRIHLATDSKQLHRFCMKSQSESVEKICSEYCDQRGEAYKSAIWRKVTYDRRRFGSCFQSSLKLVEIKSMALPNLVLNSGPCSHPTTCFCEVRLPFHNIWMPAAVPMKRKDTKNRYQLFEFSAKDALSDLVSSLPAKSNERNPKLHITCHPQQISGYFPTFAPESPTVHWQAPSENEVEILEEYIDCTCKQWCYCSGVNSKRAHLYHSGVCPPLLQPTETVQVAQDQQAKIQQSYAIQDYIQNQIYSAGMPSSETDMQCRNADHNWQIHAGTASGSGQLTAAGPGQCLWTDQFSAPDQQTNWVQPNFCVDDMIDQFIEFEESSAAQASQTKDSPCGRL